MLKKALEEVEKNFATMRCMLIGDGENEPNADQVTQLALEICKEDVISLLVHKLPILGWEVSSCCFRGNNFSEESNIVGIHAFENSIFVNSDV